MEIKAQIYFQETVRKLQTAKFKLMFPADSMHKDKMRVVVDDELPRIREGNVKVFPKEEVITLVNTVRDKIADSLQKGKKPNAIFISTTRSQVFQGHDSVPEALERKIELKGPAMFRYLRGVDSLQDTLKLTEINSAYEKT